MDKNSEIINSQIQENNDTINIREEVEKYAIYWKWFVLGVTMALIGAFLYLRYTTPQYSASSTIMIKDNQKSGISQELSAIADLGIVGTGSVNNTDNEIEIIKSRKIIGQVVDSLDLDILYFREGRIKKTELYNSSPIKLVLLSRDSAFTNKDTLITISFKDKNKFQLKNIDREIISTHNYNEVIISKIGKFKISRNTVFEDDQSDVFILINKKSKIIDSYRERLNISSIGKNSSVLNLSIKDAVRQKAEDFLDELVRQYNIDAINDKSEVSKKTRDFISERIEKIGQDLSKIQDSVKDYREKNKITGLSMEGELALENASKNNEKIIELKTELSLAKGIYESLNSDTINDADETLPPNLGFKDLSISESIIRYNELVNEKNALSLNAGAKNPLLIQYRSEINSQRRNLKKSIKNHLYSLEAQLEQLNKSASLVSSKVSSIPALERGFIDIARQQEIISGLFSYLLKKKEETDISLAVTVPNAKIIDVAYSSENPVSPKKKIIYLAALLLGLLIPFIIIYLKNLLDTKIHNKKDIEAALSVPFLGDIPKSESNEKIIVSNDARSSGSEAFRLIRTNLDFMLANNTKNSKFIFITSTTSGEGKSFISINLAATLALSNRKVLLMGMDLRAPKVTEYLGIESRKGITNYITNDNLSLDDIRFSIPESKGLDIISSGAIPPNPAELLASKSIENLFKEVRDLDYYDFIIVDTAPVNLVTDTLLISKYADMFLYVVRANYLDKRLLAIPEELYKSKRLPNMSIVLNDTDPKRSYGYGYGYGGYGYLSEDETKPWYKKIFS
ncbi:polysaccharide biosynthesis tyrosine autokinase [Polaribacter batillariae]|uniref:non-specific protein-tyrosine kinase n=1 Tax=Polaribacter batillariae TaxID=2808900 RepID=A0ABX7SSU1_9FLAO|nr:polysaccharide biosynthesis tyrosine autokinase [Polaribacter batillariae]QTD37314.1 polysaccharide biosynthesis tyrosine autokinase [Polaribacter batillariae]